ncbi:TFIID subunit 4B Transcription initiation factor [Triplophysa tibetana]|uniref:TFIID subunit 4B Transcription initiation factor n=1 Tax=Triplophysa tibetana TaxID=1572043 RepID=A0A5A9NFH7_9TELE|nr:TFIID subunit 4B Transcription initiation factor [Triplophysa tibetana]
MAETSVSNELNNNHTCEKTDEESAEAFKERDDGRASISEEPLQTKQTASGKENETSNPDTSKNSNSDTASHNEEQPKQKEAHQPVTSTSLSVSSEPAPKITAGTAHVRSTTPVMVGARVVTAASGVQGSGATSLALVPQPAKVAMNQPRVTPLTAGVTLSRISTPSQNLTVMRAPAPLQLPANFQVPQGMVLIRSDSGQLMLVSQQALAQAQAQGMLPKPPNASAIVRPLSTQATASPIIRVSLPPSTTTNFKPNPTTVTVQKPRATGTAIFTPSSSTGTTIIKPGSVIGTAVKKLNSTVGTVIKASQMTPNISTAGTFNQRSNSVSAATVINSPAVKSTGKGAPGQGNAPRMVCPNIQARSNTNTSSTPVTVTADTLENVKKCKNFLVTLMKLASSGTRSANMAENVKALVKGLLDGKLEAEEFTEKLYMELKSSPQPYLVPFLKRSLPAVRQLTPNSQHFIQQCEQIKPSDSTQKPPSIVSSSLKSTQPTRTAQLLVHQPKGVIVKHSVTSSPQVVLPAQTQSQPKQLVIQTKTHPRGVLSFGLSFRRLKRTFLSRPLQHRRTASRTAPRALSGVNVSEENARILASGSELVGSVIRSCQEEPFLFPSALQTRVLHIGGSLGITDVCPDVLEMLSLATQKRLRDLLEKLTAVAQHRQISYKDDWRYSQTSDTRSQLKFLEQLERLEKQRQEEEEREALLRIARSRSNNEDPDRLRLKQRAKEMQQLELAQMEHRDANLAALAALGPRKRKPLEAPGPRTNQLLGPYGQFSIQKPPIRVTLRDLIFCMEQDPTLRHSLMIYKTYLQ